VIALVAGPPATTIARSSDPVGLAIPVHRFANFDAAIVVEKVVVDAMNYWAPVEGLPDAWRKATTVGRLRLGHVNEEAAGYRRGTEKRIDP
jgi:hypothetical protein